MLSLIKETNDILELEKMLNDEQALEKPRATVTSVLETKISTLTVPSKEEESKEESSSEENSEKVKDIVVKAEEVIPPEEKPTTEIIPEEKKDYSLIITPFKTKLTEYNINNFTIENVDDALGYKKVKDGIRDLKSLRGTVEAARKTFNAPLQKVISETNTTSADFVLEIREIENELVRRKGIHEEQLLDRKKEKQKKAEEKKAAVIEKQKEASAEEKKAESAIVSSEGFKNKYGDILARAHAKKKRNEQEPDNDLDKTFGPTEELPVKKEEVVRVNKVLNDDQKIAKLVSLLTEARDMEAPDSESSLRVFNTVSHNVNKLLNYIASHTS